MNFLKHLPKATKVFNSWAKEGRDQGMEKGHSHSVNEMLEFAINERAVKEKEFSFLDLGCGNGWVVHKMIKERFCYRAVGIDGAKNMIAKAKLNGGNGEFILADLNSYKSSEEFDLIHSMEVLYYLDNPEESIKRFCDEWLKPGGRFISGIDHYYENKESHSWEKKVGTAMLMLSEDDWFKIFKKSCLKNIRMWRANKSKNWAGTLVLTGEK
tara:strand:+ start:406 stop:1041 length:636 start_codon:yes stop_codon:yes gene_type:complete